jgi:hypothetical protein
MLLFHVVTFVISWVYTFLDFIYVLGGPLQSVKPRFHCTLAQDTLDHGEAEQYIHSSGDNTSWNMKITDLWAVMPCSLVVHYPSFKRNCCLHLKGTTQKKEAVGSFEILAMIYQIMWRHLQKR